MHHLVFVSLHGLQKGEGFHRITSPIHENIAKKWTCHLYIPKATRPNQFAVYQEPL